MTPRQRIVATLRGETPDRIPLDIGGTESSGLTAIASNRLRAHLAMPPGRTQVFDTLQQVVKIAPDLRQRLQIDTVPLLIEPRAWRPFTLPDGSACEIPAKWAPQPDSNGGLIVRDSAGHITARMPAGGYYFEPAYFPLARVTEPTELDDYAPAIESFDWPAYADESLDDIAARARRLFDQTDYAIVANLQCHLLAAGQFLRGYEQFMVDLLADKKLAHALLQRLTDAYKRRAEAYLARVGRYTQVLLFNDDLGTQNGPMMSPECYREMIWPYQKELFGFVKARTDAAILFHSCGAVSQFIPLLIDAGVDALNPVQVSAAGMNTAELKHRFGDRITFWGGGCDTQHVLPKGTPRQIAHEVARRIADLAPGGRFVFTQVHNIQPDVPPENVMAMLDAFAQCR